MEKPRTHNGGKTNNRFRGTNYAGVPIDSRITAVAMAVDPSRPRLGNGEAGVSIAQAIARGEELCCKVEFKPQDATIAQTMSAKEEPKPSPTRTPVKARLRLFNPTYDASKDEATQRFFGHSSLYLAAHPENEDHLLSEPEREKVQARRRRASRKVDKHFYAMVQQEFGLDSIDDAKMFHENQRENVNRTLDYVRDRLYPEVGGLAQRNEVRLPLNPSRAVELHSNPATGPTLRFEVQRQYGLELATGQLDARERQDNAAQKLAQIQELLDRNLYAGEVGSTRHVTLRAMVDRKTNDVLGIDGIDGFHIKRRRFTSPNARVITRKEEMREVPGIGSVLTNPSLKPMESSIVKLFKKAHIRNDKGRGDELNTADVEDIHRMLFVVYGGTEQVTELVQRVRSIIENNQEALYERDENGELVRDAVGDPIGTAISVDDNETNGDRSQAKDVCMQRDQIMIAGLDKPIELKFQTYEDFLRNEIQTGIFRKDEQTFDGSAHVIYDFNRITTGIDKSMFPQEIYSHVDLAAVRKETIKKIAKRLKS